MLIFCHQRRTAAQYPATGNQHQAAHAGLRWRGVRRAASWRAASSPAAKGQGRGGRRVGSAIAGLVKFRLAFSSRSRTWSSSSSVAPSIANLSALASSLDFVGRAPQTCCQQSAQSSSCCKSVSIRLHDRYFLRMTYVEMRSSVTAT